jgi:hypothetical protein
MVILKFEWLKERELIFGLVLKTPTKPKAQKPSKIPSHVLEIFVFYLICF